MTTDPTPSALGRLVIAHKGESSYKEASARTGVSVSMLHRLATCGPIKAMPWPSTIRNLAKLSDDLTVDDVVDAIAEDLQVSRERVMAESRTIEEQK